MKVTIVMLIVVFLGITSADVIIDEDFESGVMPTNWEAWQEGDPGAACWAVCAVGDSTFMPDPAHSGTHYAWHDDYGYDSSESWLVTDTYDFSGFDNVYISFWRYAKYPTYYIYTGLYYSTVEMPGPGDFVELIELGDQNFDQWFEFPLDISTETGGEQFVTLAWFYQGAYDHAEAIDDVFLEATFLSLECDTWGAIKTII